MTNASLYAYLMPLAIIMSAIILALACSTPRYEIVAIQNSTNPAVWKLDKFSGDVYLCATAGAEGSESGCSVKLKQF